MVTESMRRKAKGFQWNSKRDAAAMALAQGYTEVAAADMAGVSRASVQRWKREVEFISEVDRLTLMTDIARRAERLRICMQVVRQKVREDGLVETEKDVLDWLKFAQSETDGLDNLLASVFSAMAGDSSDQGQDTTASD